jgi:hypothetical protein
MRVGRDSRIFIKTAGYVLFSNYLLEMGELRVDGRYFPMCELYRASLHEFGPSHGRGPRSGRTGMPGGIPDDAPLPIRRLSPMSLTM